jgi:carboxymethylenebutenolidase
MTGTCRGAAALNSESSTVMAGISDDPTRALPWISPRVGDLICDTTQLTIAEIALGSVPRGAVLMLCDTDGFDEVGEPMTGLAEHGYESLAAAEIADDADADRVVDVLLERLGESGWELEQVGVIGYGRGARNALRAAARYTLGAAVSVADLLTPGRQAAMAPTVAALRTPWLGLTRAPSDRAAATVLDRLDRIRTTQTRVYTELIGYPQVPEHFCRNTAEASAVAAAFDSWQRTLEWLNNRVVPRQTPASLTWRSRLPVHCGTP